MIHRMTLTSNKRLILLYTSLVLLPLIGLSTFRFLSPVWAIVCLGICLFLDRSLYRLAKPFLNSTIESLEDRIVISVPGYDAVEVAFNEVDLAGEFQIKGKPALFLYKKEADQLYTLPDEYTGFNDLRTLLSSRLPFEEIPAGSVPDLKDILKQRYL